MADRRQLEIYPLYDGTPPHESAPTSKAAAESIKPVVASMRERVYSVIVAAGRHGATCDEIEAVLDGRHQSISARVRELYLLGRVVNTGNTRKTRSGRQAAIYESKEVTR